ncbi:MAG: hypothetical protein PWQ39_149 [Thermacetogenium sp.]|nr:hypothetical protein [Thermacetogenium sp.]
MRNQNGSVGGIQIFVFVSIVVCVLAFVINFGSLVIHSIFPPKELVGRFQTVSARFDGWNDSVETIKDTKTGKTYTLYTYENFWGKNIVVISSDKKPALQDIKDLLRSRELLRIRK